MDSKPSAPAAVENKSDSSASESDKKMAGVVILVFHISLHVLVYLHGLASVYLLFKFSVLGTNNETAFSLR